ncbi:MULTISPECIES: dioxygenase [Sphingobium]|uniref:dioxygenase family protein n=1 Tax=Sphingobium TaxID=165695 RepID=UPI00159C41D3|nr:dioxygenase [Sphingobium sp. 15-1]
MQAKADTAITQEVIRAMSGTPDPRLRQIMEALVENLHDFARRTRLTRPELDIALDFLNAVGKATNDRHNEAVLLSDVLGFSTLLCDGDPDHLEEAEALLGPFWRMHSPRTENGATICRSATPGPKLEVQGVVIDAQRQPIAGVEVDVWHASPVGLYENQDEDQVDMNLRGKFTTDAEGRFWFTTVLPAGYPVPTHGPVGGLLRAQGRHPFRPAHLHFLLWKPGYETRISQVFVNGDQYIDTDVVFGVTPGLIGQYEKQADGSYRMERTFAMHAGEAYIPKPPID